MRYSLHRARDWDYQRLSRYNSALTQAAAKISARFPDDINPALLAENIASGRAELWLILDERQEFVAFLTTETEIALSGKKRLLALELAGKGDIDAITALLPQLEAYAKCQGAAEICPYGRLGWKPALAQRGYKIAAIKYAKEL